MVADLLKVKKSFWTGFCVTINTQAICHRCLPKEACRIFEIRVSLVRSEIRPHEPKSLVVAGCPLEIVHERPGRVNFDVDLVLLNRSFHLTNVFCIMRDPPVVIELRVEISSISARRNSIFCDENRVLLRIICLVDVRKDSSEAPWNAKKPSRAGLRPLRAAQSVPRASAIIPVVVAILNKRSCVMI